MGISPRIASVLLLTVSAVRAAAVVNTIVDAASLAPRVAPGALATILGSGLGNGTAEASRFPLPRSLAGTSVYINQSQVPLLFVSPTQINFQVPSGLMPGTAILFVTVGAGKSLLYSFTVTSAAPGIFQDNGNRAVARNASDGYVRNSPEHPAPAGSIVVVYLSGLGAVSHPVPDGEATPSEPLSEAQGSFSASIGGLDLRVLFLGLTPGFAGLAQASVQIPKSLANGDYPLAITIGGYASASAILSVSGPGPPAPKFLEFTSRLNFLNATTTTVAVLGNTTFLCGPNRIHIIDTSNVSQPKYVGHFGDADLAGVGQTCALNTAGDRPVLVDVLENSGTSSFLVFDVTNPRSPVALGHVSTQLPGIADLTFIGNIGFSTTSWYEYSNYYITAQHGDLAVYDFSSLVPVRVTTMAPIAGSPASSNENLKPNALALIPSGNYPNTVYVATTTAAGSTTTGAAAVDIVDVSNVLNPRGVQRVTVSASTIFLGFAYNQNLLLLAGNTDGLRNPGRPDFNITGNLTLTTMDITNVWSPTFIGSTSTEIKTMGSYWVQPLGKSIFAIANRAPSTDVGGPGSLILVDATNARQPFIVPFSSQFGISGIDAINGWLLVPDINGLSIYAIHT